MKLKSILLGAVLAIAPLTANAAVIVSIERVDDVTGIFTGSGSLDAAIGRNLFLDGVVTTIGDSGVDPFSGDLTLGGAGIIAVFTRGGTTNFEMIFDSAIAAGSSFAGSLTVTLDAETWSAIGTSGSLRNGVGTWSVTGSSGEIPLPAGLPLLLTGLGAFGLLRKRRKQ